MSPSNTAAVSAGNGGGKNYIEHQVSNMDTLAGVAIKYGVEVADIKRMNGFATDLQMFALKTLKIPLPGRHSPSTAQESNGEKSSSGCGQSNVLPPFPSVGSRAPRDKVTTAMSTLQKYYGLKPSSRRASSEGMEMAVYRSRSSEDFEDGSKASPFSDSQSHHSMARRFSVGQLSENGALGDYFADSIDGEGEKSDDKSVRRRQKAEVENGNVTPERMLKGENSGGRSGFSASTGKGLAMRPKSASRAVLQSESDAGWLNSIPVGLGESIMTTDEVTVVRKSTSTPSLKEEENNSSASVWPTSRWSLKTDLQALSNAASITRPIFDGLPKPITGRWKTALD
ncbi:hypothetical protein ACLB2K_052398 [Fragaria x ananassa]